MGFVSNRWPMEDEKQSVKGAITNEFVAGQNSVIITMLNHIQADNKANHRENSQKIDVIRDNTSSIRSEVENHGRRLTTLENYKTAELDPIVNARKKRKWVWLGWTGGAGGIGAIATSPSWVPKIVATLHSIFP